MAEPVTDLAWYRALLIVWPFGTPALTAARLALAPRLTLQLLIASPVAFVMPASAPA